jgi:uncharacterized membrane protein YhaH (DUF805 family)
MEAIKTCLFDKYATFEGRATRSEFWWFHLIAFPIFILIQDLVEILPYSHLGFPYRSGLFSLFMLIPLLFIFIIPVIAVTVRRLHDINKSGKWYILKPLVPVVGIIVVLLLCLQKTYPIDNQYGPVPENK